MFTSTEPVLTPEERQAHIEKFLQTNSVKKCPTNLDGMKHKLAPQVLAEQIARNSRIAQQ